MEDPHISISPQQIDSSIQEQGNELHELLQLFRQTNSEPLASFSKHRSTRPRSLQLMAVPKLQQLGTRLPRQRSIRVWKSPRLQQKASQGKSLMKKAQEVIAKKCGVLDEEQDMDNLTLQKYLNLYKQPMSDASLDAITTLSEAVQELKKKKKDKKKKKKAGEEAGKEARKKSAVAGVKA
jgi:hypothetical protein